jgi:hypothetical protein
MEVELVGGVGVGDTVYLGFIIWKQLKLTCIAFQS